MTVPVTNSSQIKSEAFVESKRTLEVEIVEHTASYEDREALYESFTHAIMPGQLRLRDNPIRKELYDSLIKEHFACMSQPFLKMLRQGEFCPKNYIKYLFNLIFIHEALERAQLKISSSNPCNRFIFKELFRSIALQEDLVRWKSLSVFEKVDWSDLTISQTTQELVRFIDSQEDPENIVAIMWTIYGTVLNGTHSFKENVGHIFKEYDGEGKGNAFFSFPFDVVSFRDGIWSQALYDSVSKVTEGMKFTAQHVMQQVLKFVNEVVPTC